MKTIKIFLFMLVLALFVSKSAWAGGFTVSSIGGVTTNNLQVSKFWHTSLKPVFRGVALPGADITITIDGTAFQIAADSAGDWVFTPTADLTAGEHQVVLTSGGSTQTITLTTGSVGSDLGGWSDASSSALPASGVAWPTILLLSVGGLGMVLGLKYRNAKVLS